MTHKCQFYCHLLADETQIEKWSGSVLWVPRYGLNLKKYIKCFFFECLGSQHSLFKFLVILAPLQVPKVETIY